ncbi:MAG: NUDIX hydrolase [Butyricicoccaceae bacterium]
MKNVTLCYIEQGDEYLMLHRVKKKNDVNHDKWIGVGGKFEEGESPEDCILRETLEETGLTLTDYRYRGLVTFVNTIYETEYMHLFTAAGWTGEMHECSEGRLEWVKKSHVPQLPIWEGDKIFLRLLAEEAPFFSLKLCYDGDRLTGAVLNGQPLPLE